VEVVVGGTWPRRINGEPRRAAGDENGQQAERAMTRIRPLSDLHLEFGALTLKPAGEDVIALAGDIGIFTEGVEWADEVARALNVPVVMIAGNHEFYQTGEHRGHSVVSTFDAIREAARKTAGRVIFLECETAVIAGVRFIGATLWTDFALFGSPVLAKYRAVEVMNDYRLIAFSTRQDFTPDLAAGEHAKAIGYISDASREPFDGPTVIITHHAPSARSIAGRYADDALSPAYASHLDTLVANSGAALWQHGHIHISRDYLIGSTRVLANPRGYDGYQLNEEFDPDLVVPISAPRVSARGIDPVRPHRPLEES